MRRTSGCLVSFDGKFHKEKMTQDLGKAAKHDPVTGNSRLHFLSNQIVNLTRGKNSVLWSFIQKQIYDQTVCRLHFNIFSSQKEKKNGSPGWRRPWCQVRPLVRSRPTSSSRTRTASQSLQWKHQCESSRIQLAGDLSRWLSLISIATKCSGRLFLPEFNVTGILFAVGQITWRNKHLKKIFRRSVW